jgi:hypothetical protein
MVNDIYLSQGLTNFLNAIYSSILNAKPFNFPKRDSISFDIDDKLSIEEQCRNLLSTLNKSGNYYEYELFNKGIISGNALPGGRGEIKKLSISVIVFENISVEEVFAKKAFNSIEKYRPNYFRLDFHPVEKGHFLHEPQFHIHIGKNSQPRFGFTELRENPLYHFFDMIFSNYDYDNYIDWIQKTSEKLRVKEELNECLASFSSGCFLTESNYFDKITLIHNKIQEQFQDKLAFNFVT